MLFASKDLIAPSNLIPLLEKYTVDIAHLPSSACVWRVNIGFHPRFFASIIKRLSADGLGSCRIVSYKGEIFGKIADSLFYDRFFITCDCSLKVPSNPNRFQSISPSLVGEAKTTLKSTYNEMFPWKKVAVITNLEVFRGSIGVYDVEKWEYSILTQDGTVITYKSPPFPFFRLTPPLLSDVLAKWKGGEKLFPGLIYKQWTFVSPYLRLPQSFYKGEVVVPIRQGHIYTYGWVKESRKGKYLVEIGPLRKWYSKKEIIPVTIWERARHGETPQIEDETDEDMEEMP